MPVEPPESERPKSSGRIILPGSLEEPPETPEPQAAAPPEPRGSRIILPPGSSVETEDDLPEYPRLRPLEIVPVRSGDQELLLISDPFGVLPNPVALRIEAFELLQLLDGSLSIHEISALV
ncbi:MAG TPA: hypothetical protein VFQ05_03285, partial [Candidatus Eisenbacteria bacterium]|nr:hypothetical protein [Candidatus Eisenbacteria bacterium]